MCLQAAIDPAGSNKVIDVETGEVGSVVSSLSDQLADIPQALTGSLIEEYR